MNLFAFTISLPIKYFQPQQTSAAVLFPYKYTPNLETASIKSGKFYNVRDFCRHLLYY